MNPYDLFSTELLEAPWVAGEESGNREPCTVPERLLALRHPKLHRIVTGMLLKYGLLLHYQRDGTVIDLCCGSGFGAAYLALQGYTVTALDACVQNLAKARKRKNVAILRKNLFAGRGHHHDAACFVDALEHFAAKDQPKALEHVRSYVRLGGILLLDTPLAVESYRQSSVHKWVLSWKDCGRLVEDAGFEILDRYTLATFRDEVPVIMRTRREPTVHENSDQIVIARRVRGGIYG